jgi:uncharacterized membrane protein YhaH (DUF805 family)
MTFKESILTCFKKYADFNGRASRPEFWWFVLFMFLVYAAASVIDPSQTVSTLGALIFFLPGLAVSVRRLHDADYTGWLAALNLIPVVNLVMIYFYCQKGSSGINRYG